MATKREITEPLGSQSAEVNQWKQTLRSRESSPVATLRKSASSNSMRKSTGNLAAHMSATTTSTSTGKFSKTNNSDLERIESEYIKNLQQQVYFLELEANYLEQARKASDVHPHMTAEAERMLSKLRQMQAEVDGLHMEVKRKESNIDMISTEKERTLGRLKMEEDSHAREKRMLLDEVVQAKKEKDLMARDNQRKDSQILQAREDLDKTVTGLRNAETKIQMLRNQVEQLQDQQRMTQSAVEEKRTELLKTETMLREVEDKYYSSTATIQDKVVQDLRDEIRLLRQKLKETELTADQDRFLRNKISDDSSHLVKENALLNQQVMELQKQLDRERSLRENNDTRRSANITEMVVSKEREKSLQFELQQTKEQLATAQERIKHYLEKLSQQEHHTTSAQLGQSTVTSRLAEMEMTHQSTETENGQLRRDKMLLVDHVSDLQKQLEERERELSTLRPEMLSLEARLKQLEHLKGLEASLHSQKWDEFSRLADSMKSLSRSMATGSPRHTTAMLDYS